MNIPNVISSQSTNQIGPSEIPRTANYSVSTAPDPLPHFPSVFFFLRVQGGSGAETKYLFDQIGHSLRPMLSFKFRLNTKGYICRVGGLIIPSHYSCIIFCGERESEQHGTVISLPLTLRMSPLKQLH